MAGPIKQNLFKMMRPKLLTLLQWNTEALFPSKLCLEPLNVEGIYKKIKQQIRKKIKKGNPDTRFNIRTLYNWLKALEKDGYCDKIARNRNRYYYLKSDVNPKYIWKEMLKPYLNLMQITGGWTGSCSLTVGKEIRAKDKPQKQVMILGKTAVLEAGIDITSDDSDPETEKPKDIGQSFFEHLESDVQREFYQHYRIGLKPGHTIAELPRKRLEQLQRQLKGKQLAVIFFLDGSEIVKQKFPPEDEQARRKYLKRKYGLMGKKVIRAWARPTPTETKRSPNTGHT